MTNFRIKDPGSAITHFIGAVFSAFAATPLLLKSYRDTGNFSLTSLSLAVFIISMFLLYAASTTYHTFDISPKINKMLRKIDHMMIFILILMGYSVIKIFFANLKRGGILLIQIAVGSLYMFSVPRGYIDGFVSWSKQVIGLCLTAFLQATVLIAGLMVVKDHALLGLGLMLAAGEIPRIAGQFGLDTSTKANLMSTVYAAQTAVNMTKTVVQAVAK